MHIMWHCEVINKFWQTITRWCKYIFKFSVQLDEKKTIILNNSKGTYKLFINTLILVVKQYIYACVCLFQKPDFYVYMNQVLDIYFTELHIAQDKGKTKKHFRKWKPMYQMIY